MHVPRGVSSVLQRLLNVPFGARHDQKSDVVHVQGVFEIGDTVELVVK